ATWCGVVRKDTMPASPRRLAAATAIAAASLCATRRLEAQQPWMNLSRAADSALLARDYAAYHSLIGRLYAMLPGQPRVTWAMARAEALRGESDSAFNWLARYAAMGLERDPAADSGLTSLRGDPRFTAIAAQLKRNAQMVRHGEKAFVLPEADLV